MDLISILNRITFTNLPDCCFLKNMPVLLGTKRGGHTSIQNWLNVSILDYLNIQYSLEKSDLSIRLTNKQFSKPLEPLDLRSTVRRKRPSWGYISNDPGFTLKLRNREVIVFVRSPISTFKSIFVLGQVAYNWSEIKSKKFTYNYLSGFSRRFYKLLEISKYRNLNISFFKSEDIFSSPALFTKKFVEKGGFYIPISTIEKSISNFNQLTSEGKSNLPIENPRYSYKSKYTNLSEKDEIFVKSLFLYKYYSGKLYS